MNREQWIQHSVDYRYWLETLKKMDNNVFFAPIEKGKWSIAAIISHIQAWDRFTNEERLPYIEKGAKLDRFPEFETFNEKAEEKAHNGATKEDILDEAILERSNLTDHIRHKTEQELDAEFMIGEHVLTIKSYLKDFTWHDDHHREQIDKKLAQDNEV
ncbi:DinB family protein [Jeotgalibacillus sp. S-D1]|uniref:DinB family protein n=1 Tax=Jeotgalibacillus sp. S-D1 TaxID=2552189 RepID=UPI0014050BE9|nr:DinB family protein [Jeotgalibacillus sp. S-D1]